MLDHNESPIDVRGLVLTKPRLSRAHRATLDINAEADSEKYYFNDLSFRCEANDCLWLKDTKGDHKRMLVRMLAGLLPYDDGRIHISGTVFPGLNPSFGITPQGTLFQNAKMRGLLIGLRGDSLEQYLTHIFSNKNLNHHRKSIYLSLSSEIRLLFIIESMSTVYPDVFLVESWIATPIVELQERCAELFKTLVARSKVAVITLDNRHLMNGINVKELQLCPTQSYESSPS